MRPYSPPIEEIKLAAKAGFLTKTLWKKHFFKGERSWAFRKWNGFIEKNIFRPYGQSKNKEVVILNHDSKYVVSTVGKDISYPPTPYQIHHDSLVIDVVLGLYNKGKVKEYYFEPEIKRDPILFDLKGSTKFPDAIAITDGGKIAIEVELSRKAQKRYFKAIEFYASTDIFDEVYYLSNSTKIQRNIAAIARKLQYPQELRPLRFGLISA